MGLFIFKMVRYLKSKRGFLIYEALVIPLSLAIIFIVFFMAFSLSSTQQKEFELMAPDISYHYPKTVVYSFLMMPLNETDSQKYFNDQSSDYFVRDLIWIDTNDSHKLVLEYEDKYFENSNINFDNQIELFEKFSEDKTLSVDKLIVIERGKTKLSSVELVNSELNSFLYIKTESGTYTEIFFKSFESVNSRPSYLGGGIK